MLSEVTQSSEDDLSRSAYDAAAAGIEDAKTAVNRYYRCLSNNSSSDDCDPGAQGMIFKDNCDSETGGIGIAKYLYPTSYDPSDKSEVMVQENGQDNNSDQAYTCVIVSDTTPDFRGSLTSDTRTRVIPLSINTENVAAENINHVKRVRFSWFSQLNEGDDIGGSHGFKYVDGTGKLKPGTSATIPPTIQLTLIAVPEDKLKDPNFLHQANNGQSYSTLILLPSGQTAGEAVHSIDGATIKDNGDNGKDKRHEPIQVVCSTTAEFACAVDLEVSFQPGDSVFLVASLPYGDTISDFSVSMYSDSDESVWFQGSQISVDSTGRTGQLVRRVETRLEPSDLFFPYPMYALDLGSGDDDGELKKDFWITAHCWFSRKTDSDFEAPPCDNNNNNNPN